jgi:cytochrome c1
MVGPRPTDVAGRGALAASLPTSPENLVRWIRDPQGVEPGTAMPDTGISQEDARDVAAYLYRLAGP